MFWRLLQIDPYDLKALRETGRIANAMGKFSYAVDALGKVEQLGPTTGDPELHYLRGVSLYALDRKDEAEQEFQWTEQDLKQAPLDRRGSLWLARIEVLRGHLQAALDLYAPLRKNDAPGSATYEEVALYEVEAHILCKDWKGAERSLRGYLKEVPNSERGKQMLAWVDEGRKNVDEEVPLRREAAQEWTDHPQKTLEYARALERAYDYSGALHQYREARSLGVEEAGESIDRLHYQLTPEVGGGVATWDDPSGAIQAWTGAASIPLTPRLRMALTATGETSTGGLMPEENRTINTARAWGILGFGRGATAAVGATAQLDQASPSMLGGSALLATSPQHKVQLQVRGDYNVPWRESASVLREGGTMDSLSTFLYAQAGSRVLFSAGGQARRFGLEDDPYYDQMGEDGHATQFLGVGGADVTLWSSPTHTSRGEILDNDMIAPRSLSSGLVASYRHYELRANDPFVDRVLLVERSSVDEVSGALRQVFGKKARLAGELRGGVGYDWDRSMKEWRAGTSLMVSATRTSRLTFDYDVANESGTGLSGRRHIGSVVLHVDL